MKVLILFFINDLCYFIKGCPNETLSNISFIQKLQKSKGVYVMKDVVLDEIKRKEKFKKLLLKICEDFNIKDGEQIVKNYCSKIKKEKRN